MTKTSNRPSHVVFIVEGDGEKSTWTEIGALWPHKTGNGFNLTLKAVPLTGRLVARGKREQPDEQPGQEAGE